MSARTTILSRTLATLVATACLGAQSAPVNTPLPGGGEAGGPKAAEYRRVAEALRRAGENQLADELVRVAAKLGKGEAQVRERRAAGTPAPAPDSKPSDGPKIVAGPDGSRIHFTPKPEGGGEMWVVAQPDGGGQWTFKRPTPEGGGEAATRTRLVSPDGKPVDSSMIVMSPDGQFMSLTPPKAKGGEAPAPMLARMVTPQPTAPDSGPGHDHHGAPAHTPTPHAPPAGHHDQVVRHEHHHYYHGAPPAPPTPPVMHGWSTVPPGQGAPRGSAEPAPGRVPVRAAPKRAAAPAPAAQPEPAKPGEPVEVRRARTIRGAGDAPPPARTPVPPLAPAARQPAPPQQPVRAVAPRAPSAGPAAPARAGASGPSSGQGRGLAGPSGPARASAGGMGGGAGGGPGAGAGRGAAGLASEVDGLRQEVDELRTLLQRLRDQLKRRNN